VNGDWFETTPNGKEMQGEAHFQQGVIDARYVLVGTWDFGGKVQNRWVVDAPADEVLSTG
jgi:hypothetical protein